MSTYSSKLIVIISPFLFLSCSSPLLFPPFHSAHEGYAVLLEEVDELWDEIKGNKKPGAYERMRKEAIQVGAMVLRFLVMLDEMDTDGGL